MFSKLLKHELRATSGSMLIIWLGLASFTALSLVFRLIDDILLPKLSLRGFTLAMSIPIAAVAIIVTYVLLICRFYKNIYSDEGYLTLTLPVSRRAIILSKLICSMLWVIGTALLIILALLINWSDSYFFNGILELLEQFAATAGVSPIVFCFELLLLFVSSIAKSILTFYASISIGQLFTKHRIFGSFLGYLCVGLIDRIVSSVHSLLMNVSEMLNGFFLTMFYMGANYGIDTLELHITLLSYAALTLIVSALLGALSEIIMKKAVNLQ